MYVYIYETEAMCMQLCICSPLHTHTAAVPSLVGWGGHWPMLTEMSHPARGRGTDMKEASIDTLGKDKEVTDGDSYRSLNLPSRCLPPSTMLALHQWPPCTTRLGRRSSRRPCIGPIHPLTRQSTHGLHECRLSNFTVDNTSAICSAPLPSSPGDGWHAN